jgi:hypothetical protein
MEQKRVAGQYVREGLDGDGGAAKEKMALGTLKPKNCRTYTRTKVEEALPDIVERFVEEAKKGSVPHTKILTNLSGLDKAGSPQAKRRRGPSVVRQLLDSLSRESENEVGSGSL